MKIKGIDVEAVIWLKAPQFQAFRSQFSDAQWDDLKACAAQAQQIIGSALFADGVMYHNMVIHHDPTDPALIALHEVEKLLQR